VVLGIALVFGIVLGAQELVARCFGRSLWGGRSSFDAPLGKQILIYSIGPVVAYALAAGSFFVHEMIAGEPEISLVVDPTPGSPAERAGVAAGDRVLSVSGQSIRTWDEVPAAVRARGNEPIELVVDRAGRSHSFRITAEDGRIGLRPRTDRHPLPAATAAARALQFPAQVNLALLHFVGGSTDVELAGPVAILRETQAAAQPGIGAYLVASALSSALAPAFFVDALLLVMLAASRRRAHTPAKPT
jgi:regulator of sigma E protease